MATITIILAFKRFELYYHMTSYINPDYDSKKLRNHRLLDIYLICMTIIVSVYPVKFKYYEINDTLSLFVLLQIVVLLKTYLDIVDIKRKMYNKYFFDFLECKHKGLAIPLSPWSEKNLSILNSDKELYAGFNKYASEIVADFKKHKNRGNDRNGMIQ